ncbi:MAG: DNA polymerase Y family protein, partial [Alphaproteobacteria bacterium]
MPVAARRMLALWFPHLGAERHLRRGGIDGPLATVAERGAARRLAAVSAAAEAAGLRPGMALADARAICPGLHTRPADPPAEAAFLAALARWAGRFSPFVGCDPPDGLVLDITGVA